MSKHPWQAQIDATRNTDISRSEIARILDEWFARYRSYDRLRRVDEDMFLALRNRLIPLSPGEPVQFRELGRQRWLNGTFTGPMDNPDDPYRRGDVWVTTTAGGGRRVPVFLSAIRR